MTKKELQGMGVGFALGVVVGSGVLWFDISLWAAIPVLFAVTFLATLSWI